MDYIKAFIVGGILCVIAQILIDKTKMNPARILVTYVVAGVILTGIGLYEPLVSFSGCGATTPLTGFGFSIAKGVQKAITENGAIGILTGSLSGTSGGITMALVCGYIASLIFKGHPK